MKYYILNLLFTIDGMLHLLFFSVLFYCWIFYPFCFRIIFVCSCNVLILVQPCKELCDFILKSAALIKLFIIIIISDINIIVFQRLLLLFCLSSSHQFEVFILYLYFEQLKAFSIYNKAVIIL